jgi:hypothetical protein
LEFLAAKQNDRMVDVLRHANNAEERYRERQAKGSWCGANRIRRRSRDGGSEAARPVDRGVRSQNSMRSALLWHGPKWRFPQLNFVALGVDDPAKATILVFEYLLFHLTTFVT